MRNMSQAPNATVQRVEFDAASLKQRRQLGHHLVVDAGIVTGDPTELIDRGQYDVYGEMTKQNQLALFVMPTLSKSCRALIARVFPSCFPLIGWNAKMTDLTASVPSPLRAR